MTADLKGQIGLDIQSAVSLGPVFIGQTGIVVDAKKISLHLSDDTPPPTGMEPGWQGVFLENGVVRLPEGLAALWPDGIQVENASFGSGGFTASIFLDLSAEQGISGLADSKATQLLIWLHFAKHCHRIQTECADGLLHRWLLKVPFFDEALKIGIGLTNDGDFTISSQFDDSFLLLKEGILSLEVNSLELIETDGIFLLVLSATFTPLIARIDWPSFDLSGLSIRPDGQVPIDQGWIDLPEKSPLTSMVSFWRSASWAWAAWKTGGVGLASPAGCAWQPAVRPGFRWMG